MICVRVELQRADLSERADLSGEVMARRTEALMSAVGLELGQFENHGWTGESALGAADALANAEYENELLRAIGEEIGDVDVHNRITASASTARRTTAAILDIVNQASTVLGVGAALLAEFYGEERLEAADDAKTAYRLIEALFEEVIEDADASLEAACRREDAIGLYERDKSVVDEAGTVWFPVPTGRVGVTRETLRAEPSAKDWGLEFATDLARIAGGIEGIADDEELARLRAPVTPRVVASTVSSIILGQGYGRVERWRDAFIEDALSHCYVLADRDRYEHEDPSDYETDCREALKHLLDTGRAFAAGVTAYAALAYALQQAGRE